MNNIPEILQLRRNVSHPFRYLEINSFQTTAWTFNPLDMHFTTIVYVLRTMPPKILSLPPLYGVKLPYLTAGTGSDRHLLSYF